MAKSRAKTRPDPFWAFVEENPELAQEIAFQIGFLAGKVTHGASAKALKRLPPQIGNILPELAQAALRFLPMTSAPSRANGAAPRKRRKRKARKPSTHS